MLNRIVSQRKTQHYTLHDFSFYSKVRTYLIFHINFLPILRFKQNPKPFMINNLTGFFKLPNTQQYLQTLKLRSVNNKWRNVSYDQVVKRGECTHRLLRQQPVCFAPEFCLIIAPPRDKINLEIRHVAVIICSYHLRSQFYSDFMMKALLITNLDTSGDFISVNNRRRTHDILK